MSGARYPTCVVGNLVAAARNRDQVFSIFSIVRLQTDRCVMPAARPQAEKPFDGIRFMILNYCLGALIGVIFTTGLLAVDAGGLRTLMSGDTTPWLPLILFAAGMSLTFAGLYAGVAIMLQFGKTRDSAG